MTDNRIFYPQQPFIPATKPDANQHANHATAKASTGTVPFQTLLQQQFTTVKFSQHALQRLHSRNIRLSDTEMMKLNSAVEKAAQKGAKESLVLMDNNLALIVSVKNKTVITAMDGSSIKDNVFTNIDSAVIV